MRESPRVPYHDLVTRYTAAAVYLHPALAESVLETFFGRPGRAWGPAVGIDPVAVVRHAVTARRCRRLRDALVLTVLAVTAAVVVSRLAVRPGLAIAVALAGVAVAWLSLVISLGWSLRRAAQVRDAQGRTAELGRPLSPPIEDRLRESTRANIIVYATGRPFPGSGRRVHDWTIEVDVSAPLATAALDRHLAASFRGQQSDRFTALHRLYVDGRSFHTVAEGRLPHPVQHVDSEVTLAEVAAEDAGFRRVYFCLEETARDGQLVVSLFLRPRFADGVLRLEVALHALLPLGERVVGPVERLGRGPGEIIGQAVGAAGRLLIGPVGRFRRDIRRSERRSRRGRAAWLAARDRRSFDFGAGVTVREGISTDDLEAQGEALLEVAAIGASLQDRLLSSVDDFLTKHHVDTTEFAGTRESIVTSVQSWTADQIKAEMAA